MQESSCVLLNKRILDIFASPAPFSEEDYAYVGAYLTYKAGEIKSAPWVTAAAQNKDLADTIKEHLLAIIQPLALARGLLEARSAPEDYVKNLEKTEEVPYLSKKEGRSNRGAIKCLIHRLKTNATTPKIDPDKPEDCLPFALKLDYYDSNLYDKEEAEKDCVKLNLNLIGLAIESLGRIEIYFNSYVAVQTVRALCARMDKPFAALLEQRPKLRAMFSFAKDLNRLLGNLPANTFTKEKFQKYA